MDIARARPHVEMDAGEGDSGAEALADAPGDERRRPTLGRTASRYRGAEAAGGIFHLRIGRPARPPR